MRVAAAGTKRVSRNGAKAQRRTEKPSIARMLTGPALLNPGTPGVFDFSAKKAFPFQLPT
jgi:hypothetical protein